MYSVIEPEMGELQSELHLQFRSPGTMAYAYPRLEHRVAQASAARLPYQLVELEQSILVASTTIGCGAAEMDHPDASLTKLVHPFAAAHLQLESAAWIAYA